MTLRSAAKRKRKHTHEVFTSGQVAKMFQCSAVTIDKLFDNGKLGGFLIPGSTHRRIPLQDLIKFARENGIPLSNLAEAFNTKVLLITADSALQQRLRSLTDGQSCTLTFAATGFEAGFQHNCSEAPDCVVIDFAIGPSTAASIVESMRKKEAWKDTTIIGLLAEDQRKGMGYPHFTETFTKPFDPALLVERIWTHTGRR